MLRPAPATGLQPARALRLHSGWLRVWRAGPSHDRSGDAAFSQRSRRVDQVTAYSFGNPDDGGHFAELTAEFGPALSAIVTVIQITIAAGGQNEVRRIGPLANHPHCGIRFHGHVDTLPRVATVAGEHEHSCRARRRVADSRRRHARVNRPSATGRSLAKPCKYEVVEIGALDQVEGRNQAITRKTCPTPTRTGVVRFTRAVGWPRDESENLSNLAAGAAPRKRRIHISRLAQAPPAT